MVHVIANGYGMFYFRGKYIRQLYGMNREVDKGLIKEVKSKKNWINNNSILKVLVVVLKVIAV